MRGQGPERGDTIVIRAGQQPVALAAPISDMVGTNQQNDVAMADTTAPGRALPARPARAPVAQKSALARKLPWNDKAGRFSPLKAMTVALMPLPALYLAYAAVFIGLGPQ